ncbi:hypothetical protein LPJ59_004784 [Coemansia sp. RSA 2399]|nr:hypothetical protein LPJ59_004784 [Coemansia sp. RSA 2399]
MSTAFANLPDNVLNKIIGFATFNVNGDEPTPLDEWNNSHLPLAQINQKWRTAAIPSVFDTLYLECQGHEPTTTVLDGKVASERITDVKGNLSAVLHHLPAHKPSHIHISVQSYKDSLQYLRDVLFILEDNPDVFSGATQLTMEVFNSSIGYYGRPSSRDVDRAKELAHRVSICMPNVEKVNIVCLSSNEATRVFAKTLARAYCKQLKSIQVSTPSVRHTFSYLPLVWKVCKRFVVKRVFKGKKANV